MISRRGLLLGSLGVLAAAGCAPAPGTTGGSPSSAESSPGSSRASARQSSATPTASPAEGAPEPRLAGVVAENLDVPWGLVFLADGTALVSERNTARLRRVGADGKVTTIGEVAGVSAPSSLGEGGLLGIALAPGDESTLYAYLTTESDNRVVRVSLDNGRVGRPRAVLTGIPTAVHHHGGRLLVGTDGHLLVATGDAENSALAQDRSSLAGKVLRITTDGAAAPGNPFGDRIWSYGHRNVEGLAFDAAGRLWATEFGDKKSDELNLISKGRNYGWPLVEGASARFTAPQATWSPTSTCSPAGLDIARSTAFVAALRGECLFAVKLAGATAGKPRRVLDGHGRLRGVAVAPDGALWVSTSNTDGRGSPAADDDRILRVTL